MPSNDLLQRFIFENAAVRGEHVHLQQSYQTITSQHLYPDAIKKLLGEALAIASLLTAIIKFKGKLTVQFRGKGKLKLLLAQCNNEFHLRGLAKWEGESAVSYEELMESFNQGVLAILLDSGGAKGRYQGIVAWRGNSLVESIEGYFRDSEQLATKIWLAVDEHAVAGFLIQIIPSRETSKTGIEEEAALLDWEEIKNATQSLSATDLLSLDYESLLAKLYLHKEIRVFAPMSVIFQCTCSRKRGADAIRILGRDEAEAELINNNSIVVTCDFCNKEYIFDKVDVANIFDAKDGPETHTQLH